MQGSLVQLSRIQIQLHHSVHQTPLVCVSPFSCIAYSLVLALVSDLGSLSVCHLQYNHRVGLPKPIAWYVHVHITSLKVDAYRVVPDISCE